MQSSLSASNPGHLGEVVVVELTVVVVVVETVVVVVVVADVVVVELAVVVVVVETVVEVDDVVVSLCEIIGNASPPTWIVTSESSSAKSALTCAAMNLLTKVKTMLRLSVLALRLRRMPHETSTPRMSSRVRSGS